MADQTQVQDGQEQKSDSSSQNSSGGPGENKPRNNQENKEKSSPDPVKKRRNLILGIVVGIVLLVGAGLWWLHSRTYETTDDAQVDGHLHPLSSRVDGTILAVGAEDNQKVNAGDLLVQLDPKDYQVALDQAQASFEGANAQTATQRPNVPITQSSNTNSFETANASVANAEATVLAAQQDEKSTAAQLRQSQANNEKAQTDLQRYSRLLQKQEVAQSDYDQYLTTARAQAASVDQQEAALRSSTQKVAEAEAQLEQQQSRLRQAVRDAPRQLQIRRATVESQQASANSAKAQAETARLRLSYTRIYAPVSGIVTQRSAEVGEQITTGQQLLVIVQVDDLWVTANFRETQLKKIRPGQKVRIEVDSLGRDFDGYVEAMPAASGDRTSVLPPENATGNFVKIVQRLPVRIRFAANQAGLDLLRPGMSVEPKVDLR